MTQPLATSSKGERANLMYTIHHNGVEIKPKKGTRWIWSEEKFLASYNRNEIIINQSGSGYSVRFKQYLRDEDGVIRRGKPLSILTGVWNQDGTDEVASIFGSKGIFDFPKPSKLLNFLFSFQINNRPGNNDIILDFFSGSATTAHAVMQLNAEDGGKRRHIMVQLPEPCDEKSEAYKAGYQTIAEIGKERIRRAGQKILSEWHAKQAASAENLKLETENSGASAPDVGFRVLKIDSSNFRDVQRTPDELDQAELSLHTEHIKPDRTPQDLLFQVLVDWGVDLSLPTREEKITAESTHSKGKKESKEYTIYWVDENVLAACFDAAVPESLIHTIAARKPLRAVFRDESYDDDSNRINVEQIFKLLSPATEVKSL